MSLDTIQKAITKALSKVLPMISWITWNPLRALFNGGVFFSLTEDDWNHLETVLAKDYYVILTRNTSHLSTYLVALGNWFTTGKWGYWGHALANLEGNNNPDINDGFMLMEATGVGVHYSSFFEVFKCDSVALLKPKGVTHDEWREIMNGMMVNDGKKYDNLFDLVHDNEMSCVELVRAGLKTLPDYNVHFAHLEAMIQEHKNQLTPDMLYNCPDFEVVWEARR